MATVFIDGLKFEGPILLGKDTIPHVPAIALVCTEAGEGMKIMSVVHGTNIAKVFDNNPKMTCWKKHAYHDNIDIYINTDEMSEEKREIFRVNAIEKRKNYIFCDDLPKIVDDW